MLCFEFVFPITFSYNNGTVISAASLDGLLDILNNEDRIAFRDALLEVLEAINSDKKEKFIYIDDAFRNLS